MSEEPQHAIDPNAGQATPRIVLKYLPYQLYRYLPANAPLDSRDAEQQAAQLASRIIHGRGVDLPPDVLRSPIFQGGLCDARYLAEDADSRAEAAAALDALADAAGLDRASFERGLLPSCGLGGAACFEGRAGRAYTLTLGLGHRPLLHSPSGRRHTGVPIALRRDRARIERYKRLIAQKSRAQSRRLELAMLADQRWSARDWAAQVLGHPLLGLLARRLIWAGYDADGALLEGFVLAEDGTLMSESLGVADLGRFASVGIPHVADLPHGRALAWADLLHDFQIVPLFPQLSRPLLLPRADERDALVRCAGLRFDEAMLQVALRDLGWATRGYAKVATYEVPGLPFVATLALVGDASGMQIGPCTFGPGPTPLDMVPPRLLCEVLWHLTQLSEKPQIWL